MSDGGEGVACRLFYAERRHYPPLERDARERERERRRCGRVGHRSARLPFGRRIRAAKIATKYFESDCNDGDDDNVTAYTISASTALPSSSSSSDVDNDDYDGRNNNRAELCFYFCFYSFGVGYDSMTVALRVGT